MAVTGNARCPGWTVHLAGPTAPLRATQAGIRFKAQGSKDSVVASAIARRPRCGPGGHRPWWIEASGGITARPGAGFGQSWMPFRARPAPACWMIRIAVG
jgi:hypothetical protein